jgi:two-component system nitrate/nitrite response regulator NarL
MEPQFYDGGLSLREREVLLEVVDGYPNKAIAQHLGMTEAAVKIDLMNMLRKINMDNRTQATIWALSNLPEFGLRSRAT